MNTYKPDLMTVLVLFVVFAVIITMNVGTQQDSATAIGVKQGETIDAGVIQTEYEAKPKASHDTSLLMPAAVYSDDHANARAGDNEITLTSGVYVN